MKPTDQKSRRVPVPSPYQTSAPPPPIPAGRYIALFRGRIVSVRDTEDAARRDGEAEAQRDGGTTGFQIVRTFETIGGQIPPPEGRGLAPNL